MRRTSSTPARDLARLRRRPFARLGGIALAVALKSRAPELRSSASSRRSTVLCRTPSSLRRCRERTALGNGEHVAEVVPGQGTHICILGKFNLHSGAWIVHGCASSIQLHGSPACTSSQPSPGR